MRKIISTHLFVNQRLHTAMLDRLLQSGADAIEIFCARQSFDYTDAGQTEAIASWFRQNPAVLHSMHSPMYCDDCWGRSGSPPVNIADPDKRRRILAVDEIQRALEFAERAPFRFLVQHIGVGDEEYDERKADAAFTSLERLRILCKQAGVTLLVENIPNGLSTPEKLLEFLRRTHLDDVGVCFDAGHAHMAAHLFGGGGAMEAFTLLQDRIRSTHLHDNNSQKDDHLWPGEGSIQWKSLMPELRRRDLPSLMEIRDHPEQPLAFERVRKGFEDLQAWTESSIAAQRG